MAVAVNRMESHRGVRYALLQMSTDSLQALQCPRCGAALPGHATTSAVECAFCKAVVVPRPQPATVHVVERVMERVVVQAAPQDGPGAHAAVRAPRAPRKATPGVLQCPRCDTKLVTARTGTITLHGCGGCGGIWLDNAASKVVVERIEPVALELADRASSRAARSIDTAEVGIPCAVCGLPMQRTRVAQATVDVDICLQHGTWFDCDELQRVMRSFDRERWGNVRAEQPSQSIDTWAQQVRRTDWKESDAVAILGGIATALSAGSGNSDRR